MGPVVNGSHHTSRCRPVIRSLNTCYEFTLQHVTVTGTHGVNMSRRDTEEEEEEEEVKAAGSPRVKAVNPGLLVKNVFSTSLNESSDK